MAQTKRSSGKKTSSTKSKSTTSSRSKKSTTSNNSNFEDYFHAFSKSKFFIPVMTFVVITVIILLDLLFAWNNYDTFFKILGFEFLIAAVIGIFMLAINTQDSGNNTN